MGIGLRQISPGIMINSSWEMTSERFVWRLVKNACSSVNWLMKRFLSSCFGSSIQEDFFHVTCYLIFFCFALSAEVEKATDDKTYIRIGNEIRGAKIHLRTPLNGFPLTTHQMRETIISISRLPHKWLSAPKINFYFCLLILCFSHFPDGIKV